MGEHGQTVEALRDTRYLAQSQKKAVDDAKLSDKMVPGRTANDRNSTNRKFSVDFLKRCTAEYEQAIKKYQGDTEKLVNVISHAPDAIVNCYSGKCGITCASHSLGCRGLPENCWQKEYLPPHAQKLQPTEKFRTIAIKCAALRAPLPPNTRVTRQLEKRQKMHQHDKLRQKSV